MNKKLKLKSHIALSQRHKRRLIAKETKLDMENSLLLDTTNDNNQEDIINTDTEFEIPMKIRISNDKNIDSENTSCFNNSCYNRSDLESASNNMSFFDVDDKDFQVVGNNKVEGIGCKDNLEQKLITWALEFNIQHNALSSLLCLLNRYTNQKLPTDARTLLRTPRSTMIRAVANGHYLHLGLKCAVQQIILQNKELNNSIDLLINIDGLPLSRSSNACLWPILCSENIKKHVFLVGAYYGAEKPKDVNCFLEEFVEECVALINDVFTFGGKLYNIRISALICDAPAKSLVLQIKGHGGYNSCSKCKIKGEYLNNRVCFPPQNIDENLLRKDEDYLGEDEEFLLGKSLLLKIPHFGPVTNVPLDYMHLVCLGVVKRLVLFWIEGKPLPIRLPSNVINKISERLLHCRTTTPIEISRRPRSLSEIHHWKATEFRTFILYLGPVVLKSQFDDGRYINFLSLHIPIRILCSHTLIKNEELLQYAERLLDHFVRQFAIIYGTDKVSHNVHNLIHMTRDVRNFGTLDDYSAFRFENYMSSIKKLIRKNDKPLQQLNRRYCELTALQKTADECFDFKLKEEYHDLVNTSSDKNVKLFKVYECRKYVINCHNFKDRCVLLCNGSIFEIDEILVQEGETYCVGRAYKKIKNLYKQPCNSENLNIFIVCKDILLQKVRQPIKDIESKVWMIPYKNDQYAAFPLLHTEQ